MDKIIIKKAAVLGAGVMGAQIAALLVTAGIETYLFDLPSKEGSKSSIAKGSIKALKKLKPAPLAVLDDADKIIPANYDENLEQLAECDFVIEAISERVDFKLSLFDKIGSHLKPNVILASNTSGLSITDLAHHLPEALQSRFCGVHFFNPPRYMTLLEIIPHAKTDEDLLEALENFAVRRLGKGVVYAKDTPNFIGNRIGVFALLTCLHHAEKYNLSPDVVDTLTGPLLGRPKSATFRTMDVVGLDTMKHVVQTFDKSLPDDPWHQYFKLPDWINELVDKGALGQKVKKGVYKKEKDGIYVIHPNEGVYRPAKMIADKEVVGLLKSGNGADFLKKLKSMSSNQAQFLWACFRDLFHYSAYHLQDIAQTARDVDLAMRWGYGWQVGPFETWQTADWQAITQLIEADIKARESLATVPLPKWVHGQAKGVYLESGSFSPAANSFVPRQEKPVYQRQLFKDTVLGELTDEGNTIFETEDVRMWHTGDDIAILSFKSKKNSISDGVLEGIQEAISRAEHDHAALVFWQRNGHDFSVGANLKQVLSLIEQSQFDKLGQVVSKFQQTAMRLKQATIPTVAAIRGLTFGGGCELAMHMTKRVAALETYIGLVEFGVGLIPAGGGCKELLLKANDLSLKGDFFNRVAHYFNQVAMGEVSSSAIDAKVKHYLTASDGIVFNPSELLYVAKCEAKALAESCFVPQTTRKFKVAGKAGIANLQTHIVNMREGNFISDHDYLIASKLAVVMCGGNIDANSIVDEAWLLNLEHEAFLELAKTKPTQERIKYMLENGKALRN